jgi:hypothetical protein
MTVNGICYWYGNNIYLFTMAGTGIYIGSPSSSAGTATNPIYLSSTSVSVGYSDYMTSGTGGTCYYTLTAISGDTVGKYYLEFYDTGTNLYPLMATIYIVTANYSYSISGNFNGNYTDSTYTIEVWNGSGSVGTITLTGTAYV